MGRDYYGDSDEKFKELTIWLVAPVSMSEAPFLAQVDATANV